MAISCANILIDGDLKGVSKAQRQEIVKTLDEYIKKSKSSAPDGYNNLTKGTQDIITRLRDEFRLQTEIKYQDDLRNLVIKKRIVTASMSGVDPFRYLLNMMEGGWGQRLSVDYQGKANGGRAVTMFLHDLEKQDLLDAFRDGKIEKEIFQDLHILYQINEVGLPDTKRMPLRAQEQLGFSGNKQARGIAELIFYHDRISVNRLNVSNAKIRLSPHRLFNKTPDMLRVRALGNTEEEAWVAWKALADEHLNTKEMFELVPAEHQEKYLREIFTDYYNGVHIQSKAGDDMNFKFMNPMNLGRKISKRERVIYKDGIHAHAYLEKVGYKGYNIQNAITFGLEHDGRNHALIENLGTNPEAMLRSVTAAIKSEMKRIGYDKYSKFSQDIINQTGEKGIPLKLQHSLEILNGTTRSPVNVRMAAIGASVRAFKNMALLGFATVRSANDVLTASWSAKKNGIPWGTIIRQIPEEFINNFELPLLSIKADPMKRRIAALIGLGPRALIADVVGKFGADDALPGLITKLQRNYFKLNLLTYWNDAMKTSFSMMLANHLGIEADKPWNNTLQEVRDLLNDFDISEHEWELIRRTARWKAEDDRWYLSPDRLDDDRVLSNEDLKTLIRLERGSLEHLPSVERFIAGDDADLIKRIDELKEKIARLELKKTPSEFEVPHPFESELAALEKRQTSDLTERDLNRMISKYLTDVKEQELIDIDTTKMLQRYYAVQESGNLAARKFLEGMDKNKRDYFAAMFQEHWDVQKKEWDIPSLLENLDRAIESRGAPGKRKTKKKITVKMKQIDDPDKPMPSQEKRWKEVTVDTPEYNMYKSEYVIDRDLLDYEANIDPNQMKFDFAQKEIDAETEKAWGMFMKIMGEDEVHMNYIHELIQEAWQDEAEFLFRGRKERNAAGDIIKWHKPVIYDEGFLDSKGWKRLWGRAGKAQEKAEKLRDQLPIWMDEYIQGYIAQGITPSDVLRKRNQLSTKLNTLYYDRNDFAVLMPGAKEKRYMTQGQRSGTVLGEAMRFIGQFKTFPITLMTKSLQQEMNGKAVGQLGASEYMQLAKFISAMTMMGAVTTTATDFLRNKTTRDTFDPTSPDFLNFASEEGRTNLINAFVYGGGAGFYGDVIAHPYGENKNFSAIKSLLGPTFSQYDDIIDITLGVLNGDDKAKKAYNLILQNTPGANLFYAKSAFDYLLNYQMQDIIDPGYHSRQNSRMRSKTAQEYRFGTEGFFQ